MEVSVKMQITWLVRGRRAFPPLLVNTKEKLLAEDTRLSITRHLSFYLSDRDTDRA